VRSLNQQAIGSAITMFSYYIIALPLDYWLCFEKEMGLAGLLLGFLVANFCQIIALGIVIQRSDWHKVAKEI